MNLSRHIFGIVVICCLFIVWDIALGSDIIMPGPSPEEVALFHEQRKMAEQGDAQAQYRLGDFYLIGRGVSRDSREAIIWYRKAAEQGYAEAQYRLGCCYRDGWGVPKDSAQTVIWHRKAADQGYQDAWSSLGFIYYNGQDVPQDYVGAHMWFSLAAEKGDAAAVDFRNEIASKLSPADLAKAKQMAKDKAAEIEKSKAAKADKDQAVESVMNMIRKDLMTSLDENRTNAIAILKQKIQVGTPLEKDAVLYVVEDKAILDLVPCVIAAVTDMTPAPRYDDTGWAYIGRHAGWVIANLINKLDPSWLQREKYDWRTLRDVCNDEDRDKLKSRWTQWWTQYQEKQMPQQSPSGTTSAIKDDWLKDNLSPDERTALVERSKEVPFAEIAPLVLKVLVEYQRYGINPWGATPWNNDRLPPRDRIYLMANTVWQHHMTPRDELAKAKIVLSLFQKASLQTEKSILMGAILNYQWCPDAEKVLLGIVNNKEEGLGTRTSAVSTLLSRCDLNTYMPLAVEIVLAHEKGLPCSQAFNFTTNQGNRLFTLNTENRQTVLAAGFKILSELSDDELQTGYFVARRLGFILKIQDEFAPNQKASRYQGKNGLTDEFFVDTVKNAIQWHLANKNKKNATNQ